MKILKKGIDPPEEKFAIAVYTITCQECGCVFEAQDTELHHSGGYSFCHCPFCHKEVTLENNYTERVEIMTRDKIEHYDCLRHERV